MPSHSQYDVAIVGASIAGCAAAIFFGRAGARVASGTRSQLWFLEPYIAYRFPNDDGVTLVTAMPARPKAREWKTDPEAVTRLFEGLPRAPSVRAQIIWAKEPSMRTARRKHGTALLSQPSASRCAQTLIDVTEKNVPPIQVGNFHRGGRL
jgi:hypothetical protein